jgi:hypothetical protein
VPEVSELVVEMVRAEEDVEVVVSDGLRSR